jgi:hypothetical protein
MLSKQDINGLNKLNKSIEEEKQSIISEGDSKARNERGNSLRAPAAPKGKKGGGEGGPEAAVTNPGLGMSSLKYADILRRIAEIEASKKPTSPRPKPRPSAPRPNTKSP